MQECAPTYVHGIYSVHSADNVTILPRYFIEKQSEEFSLKSQLGASCALCLDGVFNGHGLCMENDRGNAGCCSRFEGVFCSPPGRGLCVCMVRSMVRTATGPPVYGPSGGGVLDARQLPALDSRLFV